MLSHNDKYLSKYLVSQDIRSAFLVTVFCSSSFLLYFLQFYQQTPNRVRLASTRSFKAPIPNLEVTLQRWIITNLVKLFHELTYFIKLWWFIPWFLDLVKVSSPAPNPNHDLEQKNLQLRQRLSHNAKAFTAMAVALNYFQTEV